MVLGFAHHAVSAGRRLAHALGQQARIFDALQQGDVTHIVGQSRVAGCVQKHQILHDKLRIHHAAGAVFDVKALGLDRMGLAHPLPHGHDFGLQKNGVSRCADHGQTHGVKTGGQAGPAHDATGPRHGLVLPGPRGVAAALLLVVGIRLEAGDQQARAAVGAQGGVDFVHIAFRGLEGQPVDHFAHMAGIHLLGVFGVVIVDEHDVQITAITELFATQLAIADDDHGRFIPVAVFQARPAPTGSDAQHRVGQRAQVIGHLLDAEHAFHVARQGAKLLGVVCAAQQVHQALVVVFTCALQRSQTGVQLGFKLDRVKAGVEQVASCEFVDDVGMLQQITRGPFGRTEQTQQAFVHGRALQHQGQIAFPAQQGLDPVHHAQHGLLADAPLFQPLGGALQQAHQAAPRVFTQSLHARVGGPQGQALANAAGKHLCHARQFGRVTLPVFTGAGFALPVAAQQGVELLRHHFSVGIQVAQQRTRPCVTHGVGHPVQIVVASGQHMGLLVVQVLNAVLDLSQKHIRRMQGVGRGLRHQARFGHALQSVQGRAGAQLGKLSAPHHLQQLDNELDLPDAPARQLDVIGPLGMTRTALGRVVPDLMVQGAERLKNVVVQVTAEHKGQHHAAQSLRRTVAQSAAGRDHAAFHPGKALPFTALHQKIMLQGVQRHHAGARVAIGPERQVHPEHKTVFGGLANQGIHAFDGAGKVLLAADLVAPLAVARGLAVFFVDINQVNVAGHVQLARPELAHAHHPHFGPLAARFEGRAMQTIEVSTDVLPRDVQRFFGQPGHGLSDLLQGDLARGVQLYQALQGQLPQHPQGRWGVKAGRLQGRKGGAQAVPRRRAGGQQRQHIGITAVQTLNKTRVQRPKG